MEIFKNDEFTLAITSYTHEGLGVGKIGTYPVFVPGTCRGDVIKVHIVKVGKSFAYGKAIEFLEKSKNRTEPPCPHFDKCGGCAIMHLSESERAFFKKDKVENAFRHIAKMEVSVADVATATEIGYRNKNQMPVSDNYEQAMYKERTNEKIPVPFCIIQSPDAKKATEIALSYLKEKAIPPYNPLTKEGVIRHIYTRVSSLSGEIQLTIISTKKIDLSGLSVRLSSLKMSGIILNVNKSHTNKILGDETYLIWGKDHLTERLCGTDFDIYPDSFFQVNRFLTEHLYNKAVKLCSLTGKETVFDLYCGAGTITAALSKNAKKVIGIEIVPSAIKAARKSLKRAGIENVTFYEGKAEKIGPALIKDGEKADVVVLDPPRKGADSDLIDALLTLEAPKIVYVSCDVSTLARDCLKLSSKYKVEKVYPFDMFPFSHHVESVSLLTKKERA